MPTTVFDVCVVGSGPGGGIAAYSLAKAGLKVALVEAGPRLRAGVDYNAHLSIHENLDQRLRTGRSIMGRVTDFQERNHFTGVGDRPAHGLLKAVGGRSLCWAGHSLRFGPGDFRAWPISYDEVAPYYSRAERFMGVHGFKDGLWNLPDGPFLKGVPLRCGEMMLKRGVERLKKSGKQMEFVGQRKAMATERVPGRVQCHFCGHCMAGCEVDAKYTSANTPIPLALKTGNLTTFYESAMTRIVMKDERHVSGIEYTKKDGSTDTIRCRALVLSCSAVETARHLLINGLANSSGAVGRNLTSHFGVTVIGLFPEIRGRDTSNDDGTDYFHSLLTGLNWDKPNPNFEGTYQVQCGSGVHSRRLTLRSVPGFGQSLKQQLRDVNTIHAMMNMQGTIARNKETFIDLDESRRDRLGLPFPRVHLRYSSNEIAMAKDMVETCEEIINAAGGKLYSKPAEINASTLVIDSNHWVGTARMGNDPKTSVVNTSGQCHDIDNLFIGDASVFAAYPEKNPTLSNIALTWRMAEKLAARFRRGELA
jgi:choline dehydrogenase-like flavoprotein